MRCAPLRMSQVVVDGDLSFDDFPRGFPLTCRVLLCSLLIGQAPRPKEKKLQIGFSDFSRSFTEVELVPFLMAPTSAKSENPNEILFETYCSNAACTCKPALFIILKIVFFSQLNKQPTFLRPKLPR